MTRNFSEAKLFQVTFKGELRFLSNMAVCQIDVKSPMGTELPKTLWPYWMHCYEGSLVFNSSEHFYQACKSDDIAWLDLLLNTDSPEKTKVLARKLIPGTHSLKDDFHENKVALMKWVVTEKFLQNPTLMKQLQATGSMELIEGNYWGDTFWGQCQGIGKNHLGKILMDVREQNG